MKEEWICSLNFTLNIIGPWKKMRKEGKRLHSLRCQSLSDIPDLHVNSLNKFLYMNDNREKTLMLFGEIHYFFLWEFFFLFQISCFIPQSLDSRNHLLRLAVWSIHKTKCKKWDTGKETKCHSMCCPCLPHHVLSLLQNYFRICLNWSNWISFLRQKF